MTSRMVAVRSARGLEEAFFVAMISGVSPQVPPAQGSGGPEGLLHAARVGALVVYYGIWRPVFLRGLQS